MSDWWMSRKPSDETAGAIDDAIEKLIHEDRLAGELVKLRYFAGFSLSQAGTALGISAATAYRHWAYARA